MKWRAKRKKQSKKQKTVEIKEVRLSPNIDIKRFEHQNERCKKVHRKR